MRSRSSLGHASGFTHTRCYRVLLSLFVSVLFLFAASAEFVSAQASSGGSQQGGEIVKVASVIQPWKSSTISFAKTDGYSSNPEIKILDVGGTVSVGAAIGSDFKYNWGYNFAFERQSWYDPLSAVEGESFEYMSRVLPKDGISIWAQASFSPYVRVRLRVDYELKAYVPVWYLTVRWVKKTKVIDLGWFGKIKFTYWVPEVRSELKWEEKTLVSIHEGTDKKLYLASLDSGKVDLGSLLGKYPPLGTAAESPKICIPPPAGVSATAGVDVGFARVSVGARVAPWVKFQIQTQLDSVLKTTLSPDQWSISYAKYGDTYTVTLNIPPGASGKDLQVIAEQFRYTLEPQLLYGITTGLKLTAEVPAVGWRNSWIWEWEIPNRDGWKVSLGKSVCESSTRITDTVKVLGRDPVWFSPYGTLGRSTSSGSSPYSLERAVMLRANLINSSWSNTVSVGGIVDVNMSAGATLGLESQGRLRASYPQYIRANVPFDMSIGLSADSPRLLGNIWANLNAKLRVPNDLPGFLSLLQPLVGGKTLDLAGIGFSLTTGNAEAATYVTPLQPRDVASEVQAAAENLWRMVKEVGVGIAENSWRQLIDGTKGILENDKAAVAKFLEALLENSRAIIQTLPENVLPDQLRVLLGYTPADSVDPSAWRRNIAPGDIILVHTPGFWDLLIPGYWGHCGIYVGDITGDGVGDVVEATVPRVRITPITSWDPPNNVRLRVLRVSGVTPEEVARAISFSRAQVGKPYDFNWLRKSADPSSPSWYCSEIVWGAYMSATSGRIDLDANTVGLGIGGVAPDEIDDSPHTYLVGEYANPWIRDVDLPSVVELAENLVLRMRRAAEGLYSDTVGTMENLKEDLEALVESVHERVKGFLSDVLEYYVRVRGERYRQDAENFIKGLAENVRMVFEQVVDEVSRQASALSELVDVSWAESALENVLAAAERFCGVASSVETRLAEIEARVEDLESRVRMFAENCRRAVEQVVASWTDLSDIASAAENAVQRISSSASDLSGLVRGMLSGIENGINSVSARARGAYTTVKPLLREAGDALKSKDYAKAADRISRIMDEVKKTADYVESVASDVRTRVIEGGLSEIKRITDDLLAGIRNGFGVEDLVRKRLTLPAQKLEECIKGAYGLASDARDVLDYAVSSAQELVSEWRNALSGLSGAIDGAVQVFREKMSAAWQGLVERMITFEAEAGSTIERALRENVLSAVTAAMDFLRRFVLVRSDAENAFVEELVKSVQENLEAMSSRYQQALVRLYQDASGALGAMRQDVCSTFLRIQSYAENVVREVATHDWVGSLRSFAENAARSIGSSVSAFCSDLLAKNLSDLRKLAESIMSSSWSKISGYAQEVLRQLSGSLSGAVAELGSKFVRSVTEAISWLDLNVRKFINDALSSAEKYLGSSSGYAEKIKSALGGIKSYADRVLSTIKRGWSTSFGEWQKPLLSGSISIGVPGLGTVNVSGELRIIGGGNLKVSGLDELRFTGGWLVGAWETTPLAAASYRLRLRGDVDISVTVAGIALGVWIPVEAEQRVDASLLVRGKTALSADLSVEGGQSKRIQWTAPEMKVITAVVRGGPSARVVLENMSAQVDADLVVRISCTGALGNLYNGETKLADLFTGEIPLSGNGGRESLSFDIPVVA